MLSDRLGMPWRSTGWWPLLYTYSLNLALATFYSCRCTNSRLIHYDDKLLKMLPARSQMKSMDSKNVTPHTNTPPYLPHSGVCVRHSKPWLGISEASPKQQEWSLRNGRVWGCPSPWQPRAVKAGSVCQTGMLSDGCCECEWREREGLRVVLYYGIQGQAL